MKRAIVLSAAFVLCCFAALAQQPPPRLAPAPLRGPRDLDSPQPLIPRPDTTLLNDTAASGLQPRPDEVQAAEPPLPVGKHCVLETAQGAHYSGTLEAAGRWFALRLDNGHGRVWIPERHIVSLLESAPDDAAK